MPRGNTRLPKVRSLCRCQPWRWVSREPGSPAYTDSNTSRENHHKTREGNPTYDNPNELLREEDPSQCADGLGASRAKPPRCQARYAPNRTQSDPGGKRLALEFDHSAAGAQSGN